MQHTVPSNLDLPTSTHWSKMRESGTYAGIRFLYWAHEKFGRRFFRFVLLFVSLYFLLVRREQRQASRQFLTRHFQYFPQSWQHRPGLADTLRHFREFGDAVLDKLLAWNTTIEESEFDIYDPASVDAILQDPRGQLIIGTHLGNLEYCRGFMHANIDKAINILIYDHHSANFAQAMSALNPQSRLNIFQVDQMDVSMILTLKERVSEGEWIFIAADRIPVGGARRTVMVDFMGRQTRLPVGPYHLAMTKEKIRLVLLPFAEKILLPRQERQQRLQAYAQRFAEELELHCKEVPFQWFNFYDFWASEVQDSVPDDKAREVAP